MRNRSGAPIEKPTAVVMAIKKFMSGFVSAQLSDKTANPAQRRRSMADTSSATKMGSVAILRQPPIRADLFPARNCRVTARNYGES
jgi:hypothetical protein